MTAITLGAGDDGRTVQAAAGDRIILRLPENPTTGVRWDFEQPEPSLKLVDDGYEEPPPGVGAATTRVLIFEAQAPGRFTLALKRWQAWEGPSTIDATFTGVELRDGALYSTYDRSAPAQKRPCPT